MATVPCDPASGVDSPLRAEISSGVGNLQLDRPAALNALSPALVSALGATLLAWRDDPSVARIVLQGNGGKAFSAGADVRAMWAHAQASDYDAINGYFAEEYAIDLMLARYPKDVIAIVDGLCFGGGMGLAVHSRFCIATEFASFSMPETLIGFFPDAGATHFLSLPPGSIGLYLGMTGARISGPDAVHLGLASHFVSRSELAAAIDIIVREGIGGLVAAAPLPAFSLEPHRGVIDDCFSAGTVEEIFRRLQADGSEWARDTLAVLGQRSPASLRWTFDSQRAGASRSLEECLKAELDLVAISTAHPDFAEGVRAALVDKDKMPRWQS